MCVYRYINYLPLNAVTPSVDPPAGLRLEKMLVKRLNSEQQLSVYHTLNFSASWPWSSARCCIF